jgi:YggT family protein
MVGIERLLEPIMRPIRRILPDLGGIDLSPMIVVLGLIFFTDYLIPGVQQYLMAQ